MSEAINVCVTGAAGQIAYSLLYMVLRGEVFGCNQPMNVFLLDIAPMVPQLEGVVMELQDCAFPLLREVVATADPAVAFKDCHAAFLVGAMPRREGMERKDLLKANSKIFEAQGKVLDQVANKNIKVLVVGNPANTNALICSKFAPSIPKTNFTAMTRLDQNRAGAQIAARMHTTPNAVKNVIIWGNHSSTQFPDAAHATVDGKAVPAAINDDAWLHGDFVSIVQKRGAAVIAARKLSSAMSAAKAACDHMRDWWMGTPAGEFVSMGVISDGNHYGIESNLIYSFPVKIANKDFTIVDGLTIDDFAREKMNVSAAELVEEREQAFSL